MTVEFENVNSKVEVTKWYSITGAPDMRHITQKDWMLRPVSAKFVFVDGDCVTLSVSVRAVKKNGDLSEVTITSSDIYIWNQQDWPVWIHDMYDQALSELSSTKVLA
jgi:hypothetical protein